MHKRPSVFRLYDFVTLGGVALGATAIAIIISASKQVAMAYVLAWTVAVMLWAFYGIALVSRARFLNRYSIMTSHGILIDPDDMTWDRQAFEVEIDRVFDLYNDCERARSLRRWETRRADSIDAEQLLAPKPSFGFDNYVFVNMRPDLFQSLEHRHHYEKKLAGFVTVGGNVAWVGYNKTNQPLRTTALGHELGHLILGRHQGWDKWSPESHHEFMQDNGLP